MSKHITLWSYAHMRPGPNAMCWARLRSTDMQNRERLWTFYQSVLGWPDPLLWGDYKIAVPSPGDDFTKSFAGILTDGGISGWVPTLRVHDDHAANTFANGVQQIIDSYGSVTLVYDSNGDEVAIWKQNQSPGLEISLLGGPVWWHLSINHESVLDLYKNAFNWSVIADGNTPALRWIYRPEDPDPVASALITPEQATGWRVAFGVQNLSAAMQLVRNHGGNAAQTPILPWDTAACTDPLSHDFLLIEPDVITAPQHHG